MRKKLRPAGCCLILSLFCTFVFAGAEQQSTRQVFTRQQLSSDLDYLYKALPDTHYNPFAYVSADEFHARYVELQQQILRQDSLDVVATVNLFQQLTATLRNGHTEIDFPAAAYINYAQSGGVIFPLEITYEQGKAVVSRNFSQADIAPGTEILSINKVPYSTIEARIFAQISAEREYFKQAKLSLISFPRYYWQVYGEQRQFELVLKGPRGLESITVDAVPVISGFETQRDEILNATMEIKSLGQAVYLNPGNFSGDENNYRSFIDNAFQQIRAGNTAILIIDLRNNAGGDDAFSNYLVSYLADRPFRWSSHFSLKTSQLLKMHTRANRDITQPFWQAVLSHEDGTHYDYDFGLYPPKDESLRFTGQVVLLINRQTHSQAAVTAAQIQDYGWAVLAGEETADTPSLYASQFAFTLPETGIEVKTAKGKIVRVNGSERLQGVLPDIYIPAAVDPDTDWQLQEVLSLIEQQVINVNTRKP